MYVGDEEKKKKNDDKNLRARQKIHISNPFFIDFIDFKII